MRRSKKIALLLLALVLLIASSATAVGWMLSAPAAEMQHSPQYRDGKFTNIEPEAGMEFTWKQLSDAFSASERSVPSGDIPVDFIDAQRFDAPPAAGLQMAWFGHATVLVEIDGKRILTDPIFSERASPFSFLGPKRFHPTPVKLDELQGIDAVLISHNHYDHLDEASIRHLSEQGSRFFVPLGNRELLLAWDVPEAQIAEMDWWQEAQLDDLRIVATPSRHYSSRGTFDYQATLWASWTVLGPENRLFFSGDTGYSRVFSEIGQKFGPFDATIIKIGAYGPGANWHDIHMPPEEAIQVHQDVQGEVMLPVHWGTFNLAYHAWDEPIIRSRVAARRSEVTLLTPRIGQFVQARESSQQIEWWTRVK